MQRELRAALKRHEQIKTFKALALISPALVFILAAFILPIGLTLYRAVDNGELRRALPGVYRTIGAWAGEGLPDEQTFKAMADDLRTGFRQKSLGNPGRRLNLELPGFLNLLQSTGRKLSATADPIASYQTFFGQLDHRWADPQYWHAVRRASGYWTDFYFLTAFDLRRDDTGAVVQVPEAQRLFIDVLIRSLWISLLVTAVCFVIGFPIAFTMSTLSPGAANAALMLVLLPFWTSILVRTTAWLVLLQKEGLVNGFLLLIGVLSAPESLMFTRFGVIVALSHVLLPYMVLTQYAVMKGIDPLYVRSARSLGANPWQTFSRVYFPLALPGIAAGCLLVFILSIGSYVTPALIGGRHDQMISYFIAFNVNQTVNWGLAAALSVLLLALVLALYPLYARFAGIKQVTAR